jgi:hypothetical protein
MACQRGLYGQDTSRSSFHLKRTLARAGNVTAESKFSAADLAALFAVPSSEPQAVKPYRYTQHRFEAFLLTRGQLLPMSRNDRFAMLLDTYRDLLVDQRGMSKSTVRNHMRTVTAFLNSAVSPGTPLAELSMPNVDRFVADSGEQMSRQSLQQVVAHLRSFLLFLYNLRIPRKENSRSTAK